MDSHRVEVRQATVSDVDTIVPLFDAYRRFYRQSSEPERARQFLLDRLGHNQSIIFIAFADDTAIGFTQLYPERLLESEPLRFQMTAHQVMRVVSNFTHFPTYRESQCVLKLYSRNLGLTPDIGPASQWTEMMSYPIALHHTFYPQ